MFQIIWECFKINLDVMQKSQSDNGFTCIETVSVKFFFFLAGMERGGAYINAAVLRCLCAVIVSIN